MGELLARLTVAVFATGILLTVALWLRRMLIVYGGAPSRRMVDASSAGLQPPRDAVPIIAALMALGFRRLGEAQLDLPGVRAIELAATTHTPTAGGSGTRHTVFVMIDPDGTIVAETGKIPRVPILVSLNGAFADGSVVETMYPRGESIHAADFHSGHNSESLERAVDEQRAEMSRWRMSHGEPRRVETMADYLRGDAEYRQRFAKRKLRGPLVRKQLLPMAMVVIAVVVLTFWALSR